jgi:hypothetical protein
MLSICALVALAAISAATPISIDDPSSTVDLQADSVDNTLLADYNVQLIMYLMSPLQSAYSFNGSGNMTAIDHQFFTVDANDTDVILVSDGAQLNLSFVEVLKVGYSSNLLQSSFFGVNAAINVQNASTAYFDHVNITVHNGAANIYSYGNDTVVHVDNAYLYSSGPVSHGLYSSGYGAIVANNIEHYSGGYRSSSFSGDSPAGYINITNAVAHTAGIGSAIFYALGKIVARNVVGLAEKAPSIFMDGIQSIDLYNADITGSLLGGIVIFCSQVRQTGGRVNFTDSKLTAKGKSVSGTWFGNTIASVNIYNTEIVTESGILVVANYSQVTQDFDYYADYNDNNNLLPAIVTFNIEESQLSGDLVAYNGSSINWSLKSHSSWTGAGYVGFGEGFFNVDLDSTSTWTLTADTILQNFTSEDVSLSNIMSGGHNIYYNSTAHGSIWLNGSTIALRGGGSALPIRGSTKT